ELQPMGKPTPKPLRGGEPQCDAFPRCDAFPPCDLLPHLGL
ncbi:MAG: hypothetical protein AVDCRST_MAG56-1184, partial [uncultured Cytophagales bacterium]